MQDTLGYLDAMLGQLGIGPGCKKHVRHSNDVNGSPHDLMSVILCVYKLFFLTFFVFDTTQLCLVSVSVAQVNTVSLGASLFSIAGEVFVKCVK